MKGHGMGAGVVLALVAGLFMGPGCAESDPESGSCESDNDCKGDRVCDAGECVDPGGATGGGEGPGGPGDGQGGSSGGQCVETGGSCETNGDCCNFNQGSGYCVDSVCADSCAASDDCVSGCCAPLEGGAAACTGASFCSDCGGLSFAGECIGDIVAWCDGGVQVVDCSAFGLSCYYNGEIYDCG